MKNQSLTLKAVLENSHIRISVKSSNDPMYSWSEKHVDISNISNHCDQITETLNKSRRQEYAAEIFNDLKQIGYLLGDCLLTPGFKNLLRNSHAESLVLELDENLVHIPWEHICINDTLLCQKYSMGRLIETRQNLINTEPREIKLPYNMWVLINPQFDLDNADSEGNSICRLMDQMNYLHKREIIKASLNTDIQADSFKVKIRCYDFIHFAGHGLYQNDQPEGCGLILSQGIITSADIQAMEGSGAMPLLIFSNACQTARTGKLNHMPFGLAHSFVRSGVRHYIGTFWKIFDEPGSQFAVTFYQNLLSGLTIGAALKQTRIDCSKKYNPDVWASYVLYGNPDISYFSENEKIDQKKTDERPSLLFEKSRGYHENASTKVQENYHPPEQTKHYSFYLKKAAVILAYMLIFFLIYQIVNISHKSQNTHEMSPEMLSILKSSEQNRKARIAQLLEKIKKQVQPSDIQYAKNPEDNWTSTPLTLSIYYDPEERFENRGIEKKFTLMIGQYLKTHTRLILLNRMSRDIVLDELMQGSSELIDLKNRLNPRLYPARLILFVEIYKASNSDSYLALSLVDTQTEKWIVNDWQKLQENKLPIKILDEIKTLLNKKYPLRGVISEVNTNQIKLNIGFDHGVKIGQIFSIENQSEQLSIVEIFQSECVAKVIRQSGLLKQNSRVFLTNNDEN